MPTPAIQRFKGWNAEATRRNKATEETDLARLAELGHDAYTAELNEEADRQEVGAAAYEAQQHN